MGGRVTEVSPEDIPDLEARLTEHPDNPDLVLRYSAALFAAGQCDSARVVALRGVQLKPSDALGPLVLGQCFERADEYDQAIAVYREYVAQHPDQRGADAVRAREMLALRGRATARARQALARESQLAQQPADPQTIAVLPLTISGDSSYEPLSRGLAQMMISDLDLLQRFRMVERLQLGALLDELQLAQTQRVDQATTARMGRLLQAGRMVQGLAVIPEQGETRLEANVVLSDGEVTGSEVATGRFRDLLQLEKQLVVGIAQRLGYVLSEAERQRILENGTRSMTAFLAYSHGLLAEDAGDYSAAAQYFGQAVQSDPNFQQARTQYRQTAVAQQVASAQPGQVTSVSTESAAPAGGAEPTDAALNTAMYDVASTQSESATSTTSSDQTTGQAGTSNTSNPQGPSASTNTPATATGTVRIVFRLP